MRVDTRDFLRARLRHQLVVHRPNELAGHHEVTAARERIERDVDSSLKRILHWHKAAVHLAIFHRLNDRKDIRIDEQLRFCRQQL